MRWPYRARPEPFLSLKRPHATRLVLIRSSIRPSVIQADSAASKPINCQTLTVPSNLRHPACHLPSRPPLPKQQADPSRLVPRLISVFVNFKHSASAFCPPTLLLSSFFSVFWLPGPRHGASHTDAFARPLLITATGLTVPSGPCSSSHGPHSPNPLTALTAAATSCAPACHWPVCCPLCSAMC